MALFVVFLRVITLVIIISWGFITSFYRLLLFNSVLPWKIFFFLFRGNLSAKDIIIE